MAKPERTRRDGAKLYYSISEVAELVNVKAHVLRYWETQFKMLRPRKNRAGNRSYRAREVQLALRIKRLLYDEGFTIAGARRKLLEERRSGQTQTELDFVGLSRGEFLNVLHRDLEGLLALVRGEAVAGPEAAGAGGGTATTAGAAPAVGEAPAPGTSGLLREVAAMADDGGTPPVGTPPGMTAEGDGGAPGTAEEPGQTAAEPGQTAAEPGQTAAKPGQTAAKPGQTAESAGGSAGAGSAPAPAADPVPVSGTEFIEDSNGDISG